MSSFYLFALR